MNFNELIDISLVGVPYQMIPHFSMFQDGRELENFQWGKRNIKIGRML